ncbi:MAG: hypothetical protein PXY39_09850 [archaeon]|nr:hypothetical protein [archaeon]
MTQLFSKFKLEDLIDQFNSSEDSIRVLAIVSPTCPDCLVGFEIVKRLFTRFDSNKLRGFVIWIAMLEGDDEQTARIKSESVEDSRITQFWDYDRAAGRLYANTLRLQKGVAWDIYLLYSPRMRWESEDQAPEPAFWMHQLDSDISADPKFRLDYARFAEESKFLLEAEEPDLADRDVSQVLLDKKKNVT